MKNNDSYLNQVISWTEFEVVVRNAPHTVRFKNHTPIHGEWDFRVQVGHITPTYDLDIKPVLDYVYREDDLEHMNEFRVKRNNERFGFTAENPSDRAYQEQATH
jgi:hypothetical protein